MIGLGNVFCILSGLLLGPVYGGLAAGVGSGVFDLVGGWASSAPTTLINKFMMAFVCGAIAWSGRSEGRRLYRVIAGAVSGSLTYCVLYLFKSFVEAKLEGSADEAMAILLGTKAAATIVNAVIADVVAVPLALAIRRSLESNRMYLGLVESSAAQLEGHDLRRGVAVTLLLVQSVLQIVCVAALLPSVQSAAAESGGGADGLAVLGCGSLLSGAGRVRCFSGAPEPLQRAGDCVMCRDFRRLLRLVPYRGRAAGGAGKISADRCCFSCDSSGSHWFSAPHRAKKRCVKTIHMIGNRKIFLMNWDRRFCGDPSLFLFWSQKVYICRKWLWACIFGRQAANND